MSQKNKKNREYNLNDYSSQGRRRKKRNKRLIVINTVASIVLVLSILLMTGMLAMNMTFVDHSMGNEDPTTSGSTQEEDFSDVIVSTNENVTYVLVAGLDESESLTDILMVVCFDHGRNTANILQIPRDTFIGSDVRTGKINAVYGSAKKNESKMNRLIKRINSHLGLPIDHYVLVTLTAFRNIVDAVGGVDLDIPARLRVADSEPPHNTVHYIGPGLTHLDGKLAEGFVRCRSGQGYVKGDMSRVEAQRNFYAAFTKKVLDMSSTQMMKIATSCYDKIKTDLSVGQMLGYAAEAKKLNLSNIKIYGVPGQGGYFSPNGQRLSYYSIHKDDYVEMVNEHFLPYDDPITESSIRVQELHDVKTGTEVAGETSFGSLIQ